METEKFDSWFKEKVLVLPFLDNELLKKKKIQISKDTVVINAFGFEHDFFYGEEYKAIKKNTTFHMLPINVGIAVNNICEGVRVALEQFKKDEKIIIHCRSGLHRSEMIRCAIYYRVKGEHIMGEGIINMLLENIHHEQTMFPNIPLSEVEDKIRQVNADL